MLTSAHLQDLPPNVEDQASLLAKARLNRSSHHRSFITLYLKLTHHSKEQDPVVSPQLQKIVSDFVEKLQSEIPTLNTLISTYEVKMMLVEVNAELTLLLREKQQFSSYQQIIKIPQIHKNEQYKLRDLSLAKIITPKRSWYMIYQIEPTEAVVCHGRKIFKAIVIDISKITINTHTPRTLRNDLCEAFKTLSIEACKVKNNIYIFSTDTAGPTLQEMKEMLLVFRKAYSEKHSKKRKTEKHSDAPCTEPPPILSHESSCPIDNVIQTIQQSLMTHWGEMTIEALPTSSDTDTSILRDQTNASTTTQNRPRPYPYFAFSSNSTSSTSNGTLPIASAERVITRPKDLIWSLVYDIEPQQRNDGYSGVLDLSVLKLKNSKFKSLSAAIMTAMKIQLGIDLAITADHKKHTIAISNIAFHEIINAWIRMKLQYMADYPKRQIAKEQGVRMNNR